MTLPKKACVVATEINCEKIAIFHEANIENKREIVKFKNVEIKEKHSR
jgi:hypothetical protein